MFRIQKQKNQEISILKMLRYVTFFKIQQNVKTEPILHRKLNTIENNTMQLNTGFTKENNA